MGRGKKRRARGQRNSPARLDAATRLLFEALEPRLLLDAGPLVISEFLAKNNKILDNFGAKSDWIEIHNPTLETVALDGFYLTDSSSNKIKWQFPDPTPGVDDIPLAAGGYLLVWASGTSRKVIGQPFHTSFALSQNPSYLGLIRPDGVTVSSAYAPEYPQQSPDISYGWTTDGTRKGYFFEPSPGTANGNDVSASSAPVIFSEIMFNTASGEPGAVGFTAENTALEFIELYNKKAASVSLEGWQINNWWFAQSAIQAVSSITLAGSTAIATLNNHVYAVGDSVRVSGATQSEYNGVFTVTAITPTTFSYVVSGTPASPAGGTLMAQKDVKRISSIAVENNVATVNLPGHGYVAGDTILIRGASIPDYNGVFTIADVTADAFSYTLSQIVTTSPTGLLTAQKAQKGMPAVTIGLQGYLAVPSDVYAFRARYPSVPNVLDGWNRSLSNGGENLELRDALGETVDRVDYADEGDWGVRTRGEKLVTGITSSGTTATVNLPNHAYVTGYTIEISGADQAAYNGTFSITVLDQNTFRYTMSASAVSPATGTMIVAQRIDRQHVGWDWYSGADGQGKSLELINTSMSNNCGENWGASTTNYGTPGVANSITALNIAPLILDVTQFPIIPRSTDPVTVTARLVDELPTGVTASVYYRVDSLTPPAFSQATMYDDGLHGDGLANDGVFGATLPTQANGAVVEFYVRATDSGSRSRTWPAPPALLRDTQTANLLYQVDNTYDPNAAWTPGSQPVYRVIMTEAERAELALLGSRGNGEEDSDATMNGTLVLVDGAGVDVRYNVGVRNRGHGSRSGPPNNFHVGIPNDRAVDGVTALNFNCRYTHEQILGAAVFQLAGLAVPDVPPVKLRVNNVDLSLGQSNMWGTYAFLESFDGDFLAKHFPDDSNGNLYTCFRTDSGTYEEAELAYKDANPDSYRRNYFKSNHDEADDWSDLIHMLEVLNNAPEATYFEEVSQVVNVEQWLRYLAVESLISNYETTLNTGIGDDFFMYRGVDDPRFVLAPHDLDTTFGSGGAPIDLSIFASADGYPPRDGRSDGATGLKRFLKNADILPLYYKTFVDLIDAVFNPTVINPLIDQVLGPWVTTTSTLTNIKAFVVNRANAVLAQIPRQFTVTTSLATGSSGYPQTTETTAPVSGTADVSQTRSVLVNGLPATWDALTGEWKMGDQGGPPPSTNFTFQDGLYGYAGTRDTHLAADYAAQSFATAVDIRVDSVWNSAATHGLIRFDSIFGTGPGQIAPDAQILSASLVMDVFNPGPAMSVHRMLQAWNETDTWNTWGSGIQANGIEAAATAEASMSGSGDGARSVDVTGALHDWQLNPSSNFGWVMLPNGSDGVQMRSREYGTAAERPLLLVTIAAAGSTAITFREGDVGYASTVDTHIEGDNPTTEYSSAAVQVDGLETDYPAHGLVRFDDIFGAATGQIPSDATIASATLTINVTNNSANSMSLYRMLADWSETATWGGDFGNDGIQNNGVEALAAADVSVTPTTTGLWTIDVTTSLRAWQADPTTNHGWALLPGGDDGADFSCSEDGISANRPLLTVTLDAGAGLLAMASQSFIAGDEVPLTPGINRVVVQTFDGPNGTGNVLEEAYIDIYCKPATLPPDPLPELADPPGLEPNPHLNLIARDSYLSGVPITVRAEIVDPQQRVDRDVWNATATLSVDNPNVTLSTYQVLLYNGMGSALVVPTFNGTGTGNFTITATWGTHTVQKTLANLQGQTPTTVSGTLSGSTSWSGIIHVTGNVTVPTGSTLTIQPGTLVLLDGTTSGTTGVSITVNGNVQSLGTEASPVTFTTPTYASNLAWGEISHSNAAASLYQYTEILRTGRSQGQGHTGTGPSLLVSNSTITLDHSSVSDNVGKIMYSTGTSSLTVLHSLWARSVMGPEISGTALLFQNSFIQDMHNNDDADGIYLITQAAGQAITLRGGGVAMIDDDCIDTYGSTILIDDMVLRNSNDKGISGYNGVVNVTRSLAVDNARAPEDGSQAAISMKTTAGGTGTVNIDHTTVYNDYPTGIGIQSRNKYGVSTGTIIYNVTNSIIRVAPGGDAVDYETPYDPNDIHVSYCDLSTLWGYGGSHDNITADPLWMDVAGHDFRLQGTSPCIDAGDPDGVPDANATRADMGYRALDWSGAYAPRTIAAGHITQNMVMYGAAGPYHVTGDVIVDAGVTLTIMPGTQIFFDAGAGLTVNGRLVAEGTASQLIRFTATPGAGYWDGLHFLNTAQDNRVTYAIVEYGEGYYAASGDNAMIAATNSNLLLDHDYFDHARYRRVRTFDSSLIVRNSTFTDMFGLGEAPLTNNHSEQIWGGDALPGGHLIIENNVFGTTKGHNDIIDLNGGHRAAGDPVVQVLNNTFLGGGDEALDIEGDFLVEGNVFSHFHKDPLYHTGEAGEANVISAGDANNVGYEYTVARNVFYDIDHAVLIKDNSFLTFLNNTVVNVTATKPAIYFEVTGDSEGPGLGAYVDGSIFGNCPILFSQNLTPETPITSQLTVNRTIGVNGTSGPIGPREWHSRGTGNTAEDPRLANPAGGDFSLLPGSPALGTGPSGLDRGAEVPGGASISGEPEAVTRLTTATLTVGGAGITHYKYRLNNGAWSAETPVAAPVQLSGLGNGTYTVYVVGKNMAGAWQDMDAFTASKTWTVDTARRHVRINEVLAQNVAAAAHEDTFPDMIELFNDGAEPIDLAGMSISDDPANPAKYVFSASAGVLAPGAYIVLYADNQTDTSGLHLDFGLDASGDGVFLYDSVAAGQTLLDSVQFGPQVANLSIGRIGHDGQWALAQPTFGAANVAVRTGNPATLKLNEWLASGQWRLTDDFVELYNPDALPAPLVGLFLTDNPVNQQGKHQIAPLSFVAGGGCVAFTADGNADKGPDHVSFKLSANQEWIGLYDAGLHQLDRILHYDQTTDVSQGRSPNGAAYPYQYFTIPTPGASNAAVQAITDLVDSLRITEVMYNPAGDGDLEFIELQNTSSTVTLELSGVRLGGGIDFTFPAMKLQPLKYVVVVRDLKAFMEHYGPGANIAGQYGGSLSDGGDSVVLQLPEPYDAAILRFDYQDIWYPSTDGGGYALTIRSTATPLQNWSLGTSWQAGTVLGGSPGRADDVQITPGIIINEILTHTDEPQVDAIELYNTTASPITLDGWYLSDSSQDFLKFLIPTVTIAGYGYATYYEGHWVNHVLTFNQAIEFGGTGAKDFALNGWRGDQVWLTATNGSDMAAQVVDVVEFGAAANGESFGRMLNDETPAKWFVYPTTSVTLGGPNSAARVGRVVVSQVMYNHDAGTSDDDLEYIEIYNPTSVAHAGLEHWRIRGQVSFDFPVEHTALGAHQSLVILPFDPWDPLNSAKWASFCTAYGLFPGQPYGFVGGYSGHLSDTGGRVLLEDYDQPPLEDPTLYPSLVEDEVVYSSSWGAAGTGQALDRSGLTSWGDNRASWSVAAPTPGSSIVARHVFYNRSYFDGNDPAAGDTDDNAVATDKQALLPGLKAGFVNFTSFTRGLNGIMVDIAHLVNPGALNIANDFQFKIGNDNNPAGAGWTTATAPTMLVRAGKGDGGSDRVTLIWADNAISTRKWLQVTVKATAATGLTADDVFYFGNSIGDVNGNAVAAFNDMSAIYQKVNKETPTVASPYDINRDHVINFADMSATYQQVNKTPYMQLITPVEAPPSGFVGNTMQAAAPGGTGGLSASAVRVATGSLSASTARVATGGLSASAASATSNASAGASAATARDAVLAQTVATSAAKAAWLYEYDPLSAASAMPKKKVLEPQAVDAALAAY